MLLRSSLTWVPSMPKSMEIKREHEAKQHKSSRSLCRESQTVLDTRPTQLRSFVKGEALPMFFRSVNISLNVVDSRTHVHVDLQPISFGTDVLGGASASHGHEKEEDGMKFGVRSNKITDAKSNHFGPNFTVTSSPSTLLDERRRHVGNCTVSNILTRTS